MQTIRSGDWNEASFDAMKEFAAPSMRRSILQLSTSLAGYLAGWYAMLRLTEVHYGLVLLLAFPVAGFAVRLFIIFHDCVHRSFLRPRRANDIVGFIIGVLLNTPFEAWRRRHMGHHAHSGNLDVDRALGLVPMLTCNEYRALTPWRRLCYRIHRHPLVLFGLDAWFYFLIVQRFPQEMPKPFAQPRILWTNVGIVAVWVIGGLTVGWRELLLVQAPIVVIAAGVGRWLFFIQHQFANGYWEHTSEWDYYAGALVGSSHYDLPPLLHWFTGNIGFHQVHHLNAAIPNYRLQECLEKVPILQAAPRFDLMSSFRCASLGLWDEDRRELVPFRAAARPRSTLSSESGKDA